MEDKQEPIAIIGMSCRFPGDADTPQGFWDLLVRGESARSKVPKSRFNINAFHHPSSEREGVLIAESGFFLKQDPGKFDAGFFSMTAAEAAGTDPQQRMSIELAYEALENAGITMKAAAGSATSCYIGAFSADYSSLSTSNIWETSSYQATGLGRSMLANRISWFFDLRGASLTLDTACSSTLVALHLAIRELRNHESKMALVGGANLLMQPEIMRGLSALHFLSPDGVCHSFDAAASGYGRGEGVAMLLLKPLNDALRDNDTIRAVIRGSALNQDGKTPGITMPSKIAQAELIRTSYRDAGLDFKDTSYFEAHGTGTVIGDPIELCSIGESVGEGRPPETPIYVGSVKTNVGHLEAAAAMAGVIKTILAMEHGQIPAIVGLQKLNPRLKLEEWGIKLNTELIPWPTSGLRRTSINSFGYGGANAHVILDDAKHYLESRGLQGNHSTVGGSADVNDENLGSRILVETPLASASRSEGYIPTRPQSKLLVFSSPEKSGTARLAKSYSKYIESKVSTQGSEVEPSNHHDLHQNPYMDGLAYTLGERRTVFDWRTFAVAATIDDFQASLKRGLPTSCRVSRAPTCGYIFTGQGSQYFNMGRELQAHFIFYHTLKLADEYLSSLGCTWSVLEELNRDENESKINEPEMSQPLCTILQTALVDLLRNWGVTPRCVVGHSSGEIAAAYITGALSREDSWKIAYFRGLYSGRLRTRHPELEGGMLTVSISEEAALQYTRNATTLQLVVACVNSPKSVTLSGDMSAIDEIEQQLKSDGVLARKLKVQTAYHSHHMKSISGDYLEAIRDIRPLETDGSIKMFSSVTEKETTSTDLDASYWVGNLLNPVRFSGALASLLVPTESRNLRQKLSSVQSLIEIGPHSVLKGPVNQVLAANARSYKEPVAYMSVLERGSDASETAVTTAGKLWARGYDINLSLVNSLDDTPEMHKVLSDLPPYPWNHEHDHWFESRSNAFKRLLPKPRTDLLGYPVDTFSPINPEHRWNNLLKPFEIPWVMDHVIQGLLILPASASIAMAIEACLQIADPTKTIEGIEFRDVNFNRALMFNAPDEAVETAMCLKQHTLGTKDSAYTWYKFHFTSVTREHITTEHSNGLVRLKYKSNPSKIENGMEAEIEARWHKAQYSEIQATANKRMDIEKMYEYIDKQGMQFGPLFKLLSNMQGGSGIGCANLTIPDTAAVMPAKYEYPLLIHPTVLDGLFQIVYSRILGGDMNHLETPVISSIGSLCVSSAMPNIPGTVLKGYQKSTLTGREINAEIVLSDLEFSKPFIVGRNIKSTCLATESQRKGAAAITRLVSRMEWQPLSATLPTEAQSPKVTDGEAGKQASLPIEKSVLVLEPPNYQNTTLSSNITKLLGNDGFTTMSSTLDSLPDLENKLCVSLLDIENQFFENFSENDFNAMKTVLTRSAGVLWLTAGGMKNGASLPNSYSSTGLLRTLRSEAPHLHLFSLDLSDTTDSFRASSVIMDVFRTSFSPDYSKVSEHEYAEAGGTLYVPRLIPDEEMNASLAIRHGDSSATPGPLFQPGRPLKMIIGEVGLLDTLQFVDREEYNISLAPDEVDIKILYTGLNFVDIMASLGYITYTAVGVEFTGIITKLGSRVPEDKFHIGQIVVGGGAHCIGSNIRAYWEMLKPVPEGIDPAAAATCLIAYATAYMALFENAKLKKGQSILIHFAAGGLGQAALQLAQYVGATIYCTVGSMEKKQILMERYGILENHIFSSRDETFAQGLMRETKGRGVDVILNSTFGEMLRQTWNCLADFGTMVEVGKRDILANNSLEMLPFIRGCTFTAVNLAQYSLNCPREELERYQRVVRKVFEMLEEGNIKSPYPLQVMSVTQAEEAFRALQSGKVAGKIVLKMDDDAIVPVIPRKDTPLILDFNATYLLAGGLGGIGRSLADLMVRHGAKHIALISRSGDASAEAKECVEKLHGYGAQVFVYKCDIADKEALKATLDQMAGEMPPVKGFIHCAMALKDTIFETMTYISWINATRPKIQGSWNMHTLLPRTLSFFILLSSTSGIIGNSGQSNYAAGNTFQNGLAHYRQRQGLPAVSIDLSAVTDIGYLAENQGIIHQFQDRKVFKKMEIREEEIHHIVLAAMRGTIKEGVEMPPQLTTGILGGDVLRSLMSSCPWASDSKFDLLRDVDESGDVGEGEKAVDSMLHAFLAVDSIAEAAAVIEGALVKRLAKSLFISELDVNVDQPLHAYGVDSLISVEIRNWVMKELKSDISILDILSPMPIHKLALKIGEGSKLLAAKFIT